MVQIKNIVFKGDFDALTPELQERMIRVLAAFVELPPDQIRVVKVMSGSIIFRVEMPKRDGRSVTGVIQITRSCHRGCGYSEEYGLYRCR